MHYDITEGMTEALAAALSGTRITGGWVREKAVYGGKRRESLALNPPSLVPRLYGGK